MFSSYLNGVEIAVSPKLELEAKDWRRCELPQIPVLSVEGNEETLKQSINELPKVGFSSDCGAFSNNRLVRYIKLTRDAQVAASRHWVMCHIGIYASELNEQDDT